MDNDSSQSSKFLNMIERIGNGLPDISVLFLYATLIVWILSYALSFVDFQYFNPTTNEQITITNMLAPEKLIALLGNMVYNYANFPPLAITLLVTLGVGISQGSGLLNVLVKKILKHTSPRLLTPTIAFISVLCHVISDSAYVILMPLSSLVFFLAKRHPVAGIAASFAGLAGGFSASYLPSSIDPIMQGFTQSAAQLIDPTYTVNILCIYFFSVASTFCVIGAVWFVTDSIIEPRLNKTLPVTLSQEDEKELLSHNTLTKEELKALNYTGLLVLLMLIAFIALLIPQNSLFRSPSGSLTSADAPLMKAVVPLIFLFFALPGLCFGFLTGAYKNSKDIAHAMADVVRVLSGFLVFSFFCAQFLAIFKESNLGTLLAVSGADFLRSLNAPPKLTVLGIIILTSFLNLIITSASSKWAILAPIFVPMLMGVHVAPEVTLAAFRLSDASINVVTPMFAFYPLIISYCRKYCPKTGVGTLCSTMLPYSIALLCVLTAFLYLYWFFEFPLGIDSSYVYNPQ